MNFQASPGAGLAIVVPATVESAVPRSVLTPIPIPDVQAKHRRRIRISRGRENQGGASNEQAVPGWIRIRNYVAIGAVLAVIHLFSTGLAGRAASDLVNVMTGVVIVVGIRRYRPKAVAGWYLLALSTPCFTAAGLLQDYYALIRHREVPVASYYDALSTGGYTLLLLGLAVLVKARVRLSKESVLDILIFVLGLGSAIWELLIVPILHVPGMTTSDRTVAALYPMADVLLLAMLSCLFFAQRGRSVAASLLVVAGSTALVLDATAAFSVQFEAVRVLRWVLLLYVVALLAFGSAALHPSMATLSERQAEVSAPTPSIGRLLSLGVALFAGPAEQMVQRYLQHRPVDIRNLAVVTALIVPLVVVRMGYLLNDVRAREERFRSLVHNSSDLILVCDRSGVLTYVSPASTATLDRESNELVGTSVLDLIHAEDKGDLAEFFRAVSPDVNEQSALFRIRHANGSYRSVEAHIANLLDNPSIRGILMNLRDTTERGRLETELRHAQKLESVGQLASGIAHEINTPIQFVGDNVRFLGDAFEVLLRADSASPGIEVDTSFYAAEIPQAIAQTLEGVDRVAEIVRAMKAFGHPGSDEKTLSDLNESVRNTLIVTSNTLKQFARVETEFGDLPPVRCHTGDINQILVNLVVNAAHAIADRGDPHGLGTITVRTLLDGSDVLIEVSDTGTGIPPEIAGRIFEPFFTTKEVGRGTGQGLSLAYTLIKDRHGGSITFRSTPNVGTTFTVRLPVDNETSQVAAAPMSTALSSAGLS